MSKPKVLAIIDRARQNIHTDLGHGTGKWYDCKTCMDAREARRTK